MMATVDRRLGLTGGIALKAPVVVATTGANITLGSTQVVDGVVVGSCERVLVKDQTDSETNGIYVASSGTWARAQDFDGANDIMPGTLVYVDRGTVNAGHMYAVNSCSTALSINVGTTGTSITLTKAPFLSNTLDVPVYDDYLVGGLSIGRGANAPDLVTLTDTLQLYGFDGAGVTTEQGFFTIHILHGIQPGTTPTMHVHWTHNSTKTGDVEWQIAYDIAEGYTVGTFPSSATVISSIQTASTALVHHITNDDDMPVSSTALEPDALFIGRIFRDPSSSNDTLEADACLIQIDMHYQRDRLGTGARNRPFSGWST